MSPTDAELAYRAALRAQPDFRFGRYQLVELLRAVSAPPADAPVALRHAHLRGVIEEVQALDPRDALEAMLVVQIIACRHAAADSARMSLDPAVSARLAAQAHRCSEGLLRAARQTERSLKKGRAGRATPGQALVESEFDLEALDADWRRMASRTPVPEVDPARPRSGGHAGVRAPSPVAPREARPPAAAPAPIERVKYTLDGQRIDLVRLATVPVAGSA